MAKPKKHTAMSGKEFRKILARTKFSLNDFCLATKIPYRTAQDYLLGNSPMPKDIADKIRQFEKEWMEYWAEMPKRIEADINLAYPQPVHNL